MKPEAIGLETALRQLVRSASTDPGVPAFIDPDGTEVDYPRFGENVRHLASGLGNRMSDASGTVGILSLNCREYIEIMLAAVWVGRASVPLNVRWSAAELAFAVADAKIEILFVDAAALPLARALLASGACDIRHLVWIGQGEPPEDMARYEMLLEAGAANAALVAGDAPAAIVYTGGTTGRAKGVIHTQASLTASAMNWICTGGMARESRCIMALPLFHVGAIGIALAQLLCRATLVVLPGFSPAGVRDAVLRHKADALGAVPTMLGMLVDAPDFDPADYAGLRAIAYGASPMPTALLDRLQTAFPSTALTQIYGMTEVGMAVFLSDRWHRGADARRDAAGQAGPFYDVRIVDENGAEVQRGTLGEVVFAGPGIMKGYLNQPDITSETLKDGNLYSGDAGIMDDLGIITLLDRKKDMIVTGAENVYSVEVENVVIQHPAVQHCAVIGVPDALYGERVHAFLVLKPDHSVTLEEIRQFCANTIAGYKCPRSIEVRDAMPLSPMGKVLKAELRSSYLA